jgi:hypothetical protein
MAPAPLTMVDVWAYLRTNPGLLTDGTISFSFVIPNIGTL